MLINWEWELRRICREARNKITRKETVVISSIPNEVCGLGEYEPPMT